MVKNCTTKITSADEKDAGIVASVGILPRKVHTATADILARLLTGEPMTALDSLKVASTMRLAAIVNRLASVYGWRILAESRAVGCADGRLVARVARYTLHPVQRAAAASDPGIVRWCADVRAARAERRRRVADAIAAAAALNAKADEPCPVDRFEERSGE